MAIKSKANILSELSHLLVRLENIRTEIANLKRQRESLLTDLVGEQVSLRCIYTHPDFRLN